MMKTQSISLVASIAILGSFGLSGCGSSENGTAPVSQTLPATQQAAAAPANQGQSAKQAQKSEAQAKVGASSIVGRVSVVATPKDRTIKSIDARSSIVAYNLDDKTEYKTTSDRGGNYMLSGLTAGTYQLVASSTSTNMKSSRQVRVTEKDNVTVDVILQAAGTIKGNLIYQKYGFVYIPGTSYLSTIDENGNFELVNVPVGKVTLVFNYEGEYTKNVVVEAGKVTELPDVNPFVPSVHHYYGLETNSSLEMKYDGVDVYLNHSERLSEFTKKVTLKDANGTAVKTKVTYEYEPECYEWEQYCDQDPYRRSFTIASADLLSKGTYTLSIALDENYTKEIMVENKAAVWSDSHSDAGFYERELGLGFGTEVPFDVNSSDLAVKDASGHVVQPITIVKDDAEPNTISVHGDFDIGVKYTVILQSERLKKLSPDGLFYVIDNDYEEDKFVDDGIVLEGIGIGATSPMDGQINVSPMQQLSFFINEAEGVDLSSVKAVIGMKPFTIANGGLETSVSYHNEWHNDDEYRTFILRDVNLSYNTEVNMTISAKDSYGKEVSRTIGFTTIKPAVVGMLPEAGHIDELGNFLYGGAPLQVYFNAPVNMESGTVTLHDDTHNKEVPVSPSVHGYEGRVTDAYNNTHTPYHAGYYPAEVLPSTTYTMKVSGFKAGETAISERTVTFTTPKRSQIGASVQNGTYYNADSLRNRISFDFFGALTSDDKKAITQNITITSFMTTLPTDKTHPVPRFAWEETQYGERLYIAFTIDAGKSYEIAFGGTLAPTLEIPNSKMTFMTQAIEKTPTAVDPIDGFYMNSRIKNSEYYWNDINLSKATLVEQGSLSLAVPQFVDDVYDSVSAEICNNLEVNASKVKAWINGPDDLNITSVYAYPRYDGYYYNGYSRPGTCSIHYSAQFEVPTDYNRTTEANVTIPASEIGEDIAVTRLSASISDTAPLANSYQLGVYGQNMSLNFTSPVKVEDVEAMEIKTKENLDVKITAGYPKYYDNDGTKYAMHYDIRVDASNYALYEYDINASLSYYNVAKHTADNDLIVQASGLELIDADLMPLEFKDRVVAACDYDYYGHCYNSRIKIEMNRRVDIDSVITKDENGTVTTSAFTLTNEEGNATAITGAGNEYSYGNGTSYLVLYTDELNSSRSYDLNQTAAIKAENASYTLKAGTIASKVDLTLIEK